MDGLNPGTCVHCGFCLPACPTYSVLGTEMDNPRGRLQLMEELRSGRLPAAGALARHLDLCLGCRACETECPSGVPYGEELEEAREQLRLRPDRPRGERWTEALVLRAVRAPPFVLTAAGWLACGLQASGVARLAARWPGRLGTAAGLVAAQPLRPTRLPRLTPASGERRARVGLLLGCVSRALFGGMHAATVRLLSQAGCEVVVPRPQGCCGALHSHAGDREGARRLVRATIAAFEGLDFVVINAAGCGAALRDAERILADDVAWRDRARAFAARCRDALELLEELGLPPARRHVEATVALHDACHLVHAQRVRRAPRALLERVPGLRLVPLTAADRCCGSAGLYNLLHPQVAGVLAREKLARATDTGADTLAAANPGCLLHLAAAARAQGLPLRTRHPLEILDEAQRS